MHARTAVNTAYELADCPACGGVEARELVDREGFRRQMERLWQFHTRRLRPGTPLHGLTDRLVFSQRPPVRLVTCEGCGTVYRDPRERERTLLELYADQEPEPGSLEGLFRSQLAFYRGAAARLSALAPRPGSGVEVGSYVGAFLEAARERGWAFRGLDVSETANTFARERGHQVTTGAVQDLEAWTESPVDAVAMWNCFDQLPDPRAALAAARRGLRPGGVLALRVPNGACFVAGTRWPGGGWALALNNLLGFPYRHGFTASSLAGLLQETGFELLKVRGDTLVPMADVWTRRWAVWEERLGKAALGVLLPARLAPWLEVYARKVETAPAGDII